MEDFDYGEGMKNIYALYEDTQIIDYGNGEVHMASHDYGKGRGVYIAGLPYSTQNTRILLRALYHAANKEEDFKNGMQIIYTVKYTLIQKITCMQS